METQNLVISFDYSWFLAKNLAYAECRICLLYTSDAADDTPCVDLGGRRIIKKQKCEA